ncbi:SUF system NifU family Fe-S cluster assembly protein [Alteromonas sp. 5E99-2]|uniref:Fe-S cluster assembly sulfur transfer protein SufU n=1 Tax=Alteromonas sp. 5E99-2 TaxID=2817683 RepID=UPI001A985E1D|nr:SUF system NifU family Fe-S cluster assembly protein [Alteromonas sp. 5E99-2]MBO1256158.1 SUF system NifU family Fe-S cluster assembly protein [Alteromonas sp. 5E99-2]
MSNKEHQAILMEHYKSPHGLGVINEKHTVGKGVNSLCGDEIRVGVVVENNTITDIKFEARACSICIASSSIMTQILTNKKTSEVNSFYEELLDILKKNDVSAESHRLLIPLSNISKMPSRHKCALLSWEALRDACKL